MKRFIAIVSCLAALVCEPTLLAQWQDQTFTLRPGWNAVYFHVDASHITLDSLIGATVPIDGIWLWKPVSNPDRYMFDPQTPSDPNIDWAYWTNNPAPSDTLARLIPNAAYLVHNSSASVYTWTVRGKTAVPQYNWTSKGMNFLGFSTPAAAPPAFSTFLDPVSTFAEQGQFYRYDDGNDDLVPSLINSTLMRSVPVKRGTAYWMRWGDQFNRYFGAFDFTLQNLSGIHFRDSLSQYTLRLKNNTAGSLTVQLSLVPSAAAPAGETAIVAIPPLLLRGQLDPTNLTYSHSAFAAPKTVTLAPRGTAGSEIEVVLGVDRSTMTGAPGSLYAGILRMTDSLGYSQIDLPVSANVASKAGLWVGAASVTQVRHYLNNYQRDSSGNPVLSPLTDGGSHYVVTSVDTSLGAVKQAFPLRLIMHNDTNGNTFLFERLYTGFSPATNPIVAITQNLLHKDLLAGARRISAPHLPWTKDNAGWKFSGTFGPGGKVTNVITLGFTEHASNPFLHTYHPDHDNLNADFSAPLGRGEESYDVERRIVLEFTALPSDFGSVTAAGNQLIGNYSEDIIFKGLGTEQRMVQVAGTFKLNHLNSIDTLTR